MSGLSGIDLLDLERWGRDGAPHEWFTRLRAEAPVWRHPGPDGPDGPGGFWVISCLDDVAALGRCPHVLSSDQSVGGVTGLGPGDEFQKSFDDLFGTLGVDPLTMLGEEAKHLLTLDPPEHTSYRKLVNKGFTPRMIDGLENGVRERVRSMLDEHPPGRTWDFVPEFAMPLPMSVIGDLVGAPEEDHAQIMRWTNAAVSGTDPEYQGEQGAELVATLALYQYFTALRLEREAEPLDDLTTVLSRAEVDGEQLSPVRFSIFLMLLASAGNETTRNAMAHGVWAFAQHPDQWVRLRDDPSLLDSAVEEVLRWASPVLYFRRNAVADMEIGGCDVAAGELVSLWYVSANRDEAHFEDPFTFDIARDPNHHVAFGGGGPHFCLGASLARLELRVALQEMLERYRSIEVVGDVERLRSNFLHGVKHLPVRFGAAR